MDGQREKKWHDIGWNGITFQTPSSWQPVVIMNDYLLFEDEYQPILELKWQQLRSVITPERLLKQLKKSVGNKDVFSSWTPPEPLLSLTDKFKNLGFSWKNDATSGRGMLLYCSYCNQATLIRFHLQRPERDKACLRLLQTLADHPTGDNNHWSMYDVGFRLPAAATLISQEFLTGSYKISFQLEKLFFSMLRFKPAKIHLNDKGLTSFGLQFLQHQEQLINKNDDPQFACWQREGNRWQRFRARFRRHQSDYLLYLHHIPEHNVILGIQATSSLPIDDSLIQTFLHNYSAR